MDVQETQRHCSTIDAIKVFFCNYKTEAEGRTRSYPQTSNETS